MAGLDLTTFKPHSAQELGEGILTQLAGVITTDFNKFKTLVSGDVSYMAQKAWDIGLNLEAKKITQADADLSLHILELTFNSVLHEIDFLTYVLAQDALDAVTKVITAAITNLTGIALKF